ncbi:MAG: hypothetical protein IJ709_05370 [Selenomonas sp.]|nr:hypothetical protein [Selenomonas sp.]
MIKKTCKGCYAVETDGHPKFGEPHGCILGFQTDGQGHPKEECPKPKTWKQLKRIEKEKQDGRKTSGQK